MGVSVKNIDLTVNKDWAPGASHMSGLLTFVAWTQGCGNLDKTMAATLLMFDGQLTNFRRIWLDKDRSRIAASSDKRVSNRDSNPLVFGSEIFGLPIQDLKLGKVLTLSGHGSKDKSKLRECRDRLARCQFKDFAFFIVGKDKNQLDIVEIFFKDFIDETMLKSIEWCAENFARVYAGRKMGLVIEALSSRSPLILRKRIPDEPILGLSNLSELTRAEWRVCVLITYGLNKNAIAKELGIKPATLRTHLKHIYSKTGLDCFNSLALHLIASEKLVVDYSDDRLTA